MIATGPVARISLVALVLFSGSLLGCGKHADSGPFHPSSDATIPGGTHSYPSFAVPAGVTVTVAGDAVIQVSGAFTIDGNLVGDCQGIDLEGQQGISIAGKVSNLCAAADSTAGKDLLIHTAAGGRISVGKAGAPATLATSGNLDLANDPAIKAADFAVLPSQRSATPLAPACAASASSLFGFASAGSPASLKLSGSGAAPSGGGLAYHWDLGDGASADGARTEHGYAPGNYQATLTVTGDDGKTCASTLRLAILEGGADAGSALSGPPALAIASAGVVAAAGEALPFSADDFSPPGEALSYAWDFGDGSQSTAASTSHTYAQSGRYLVALSATDADANVSTATVAVYLYPAAAKQRRPGVQADTAALCASPDFNAIVTSTAPAAPAFGSDGNRIDLRAAGNFVVGAQTRIAAQDGRYGKSDESPNALGGDGGRGGAISLVATGALTLCDGTTLVGGSGGDGGNAGALPGYSAKSGRGGDSGPIAVKASGGVTLGANVSATIGAGGNAGFADIYGRAGRAPTPSCGAGPGDDTVAIGVNGGSIKDVDLPSGVAVSGGGPGGRGGNATAKGGAGGVTLCSHASSDVNAGRGGAATALSKAGGSVLLAGIAGSPAILPGAGGTSSATGGEGGSGTAPPVLCTVAFAFGGGGGKAFALCEGPGTTTLAGKGGPCIASAIAGNGAAGTATGSQCDSCQSATRATAYGGAGGEAIVSVPSDPAASTASAATAGHGGDATAVGGNALACSTCPGGAGGSGGPAAATAGAGGRASGALAQLTQGRGGDATSTGGNGAAGASCCPAAGGSGGSGSAATVKGGTGPGPAGTSGGRAGNGGNGGDGMGAGAGGAAGLGAGTPVKPADGTPGAPGNACPVSSTCTSIGQAAACGTFLCGSSATANCSCGAPPPGASCALGAPDLPKGGGVTVYQYAGKSSGTPVSGSGISGVFAAQVAGPSRLPGPGWSGLTSTNTIFGAAGQCVRWDYSGTFPATTNLDLGTVAAAVGSTTRTATRQSDSSYYQSSQSPLWTAAGQTVTLTASGAGQNAAFTTSGSSPEAFTVTAPAIVQPPGVNSIPTGSDYVFTWTGPADGSSLTVTIAFDSNTATAGSEVVCKGQGGSLTIPAALLQGLPASSTGSFGLAQTTPMTVSGSDFIWGNQLRVTPVDSQGELLNNGYSFKLTP